VAEATRIKVQIVEAIEQDDFSRIPAPTYAKGFIKLIAEQVGEDPAPLLQAYTDHLGVAEGRRSPPRRAAARTAPESGPAPDAGTPRWIDVLPLPGVAVRVGLAAAAVVVAVLLVFAVIRLVSGAVRRSPAASSEPGKDLADWMRVAGPPDPVLPLPDGEGRAP
jgi:cytoskeletal protein RodZ